MAREYILRSAYLSADATWPETQEILEYGNYTAPASGFFSWIGWNDHPGTIDPKRWVLRTYSALAVPTAEQEISREQFESLIADVPEGEIKELPEIARLRTQAAVEEEIRGAGHRTTPIAEIREEEEAVAEEDWEGEEEELKNPFSEESPAHEPWEKANRGGA